MNKEKLIKLSMVIGSFLFAILSIFLGLNISVNAASIEDEESTGGNYVEENPDMFTEDWTRHAGNIAYWKIDHEKHNYSGWDLWTYKEQLYHNCYIPNSSYLFTRITNKDGELLTASDKLNFTRIEYQYSINGKAQPKVHEEIDLFEEKTEFSKNGEFISLDNIYYHNSNLTGGVVVPGISSAYEVAPFKKDWFTVYPIGTSFKLTNSCCGVDGDRYCLFTGLDSGIMGTSVGSLVYQCHYHLDNEWLSSIEYSGYGKNQSEKYQECNYLLYFPEYIVDELIYLYLWDDQGNLYSFAGDNPNTEQDETGSSPVYDEDGKFIKFVNPSGETINGYTINEYGVPVGIDGFEIFKVETQYKGGATINDYFKSFTDKDGDGQPDPALGWDEFLKYLQIVLGLVLFGFLFFLIYKVARLLTDMFK